MAPTVPRRSLARAGLGALALPAVAAPAAARPLPVAHSPARVAACAVELIGALRLDRPGGPVARPLFLAVEVEDDGGMVLDFGYFGRDGREACRRPAMDEYLAPDATAHQLLDALLAGSKQAAVLAQAEAEGVGFVEAMTDDARWQD